MYVISLVLAGYTDKYIAYNQANIFLIKGTMIMSANPEYEFTNRDIVIELVEIKKGIKKLENKFESSGWSIAAFVIGFAIGIWSTY